MRGKRLFSAIGRRAPPANSRRQATVWLLALLSAVAGVIVARRAAGALVHPLGFGPLLLTAVFIAVAAAVIRVGRLRRTPVATFSPVDWLVMAWVSVAVFASTAALCVPGTSEPGIVAVGFIAAIEEGCAWVFLLRNLSLCIAIASPQDNAAKGDGSETAPAHEVVQQITRRRNNDGTEQVFGWIRAAFVSGQRTGSVHLAFCPPFRAVPDLDVEQTDGPAAKIKTSQVLAYGARLDLKLTQPADEPTAVLLQFLATAMQ